MDTPTRVTIADDHPLFRDGLKRALESSDDFHLVGQASDGGACPLAAGNGVRTEPMPERFDPADAAAEDGFAAADVRPDIEAALQDVGAEFRAAVVLVDLQGLSLEMASDALGVPVGTVKSRVFRGRRQLAQRLGNLRHPPQHQREE